MDQVLRAMGEYVHGLVIACGEFKKGLADMEAKVAGLEKSHAEAEELGERIGHLNEQCAALQAKKDALDKGIADLVKKHGLGG